MVVKLSIPRLSGLGSTQSVMLAHTLTHKQIFSINGRFMRACIHTYTPVHTN